MKLLFAAVTTAVLSFAAQAQTATPPAKPAAKAAPAKAPLKAATRREAIELSTPIHDDDPADKLTPAELEIAKRVYVGEIKCELGAQVKVTARKREGYFLVSHGINRFVMHPVESKTGAIRLEDPARGALWLQLANKSMLMSQKEGKRLADECAGTEQAAFAKNMKPVNLLEPAPAAAAATAAPAAAAPAAAPAAPAATPVTPAAEPASNPTAPAAAAPSAAPAPAQ
jgi:hypothetical protein